MQWFKHATDMVDDPRIRRLIRKHGPLGYAVYNLTIERIAKRLTADSPIPDLEETAEDIADLLNSDTVKVEEAMKAAIALGLCEVDEITGRLLCSKIYKFFQASQSRSPEMRAMIEAWKTGSENAVRLRLSQTNCDRLSETRLDLDLDLDQKKRKGRADAQHPTLEVPIKQSRYDTLCQKHGSEVVDDAIQSRMDWEATKGRAAAKDYASAAANWLRKAAEFQGGNPDFVAWDPDEYDRQKEREREQRKGHG